MMDIWCVITEEWNHLWKFDKTGNWG